MEFPDLGTQCEESTCAILDFLPFTCDACHKIFCLDHKTYEQHHCTESYSKDVKVPVCPLCNQPVPINRGDDPNIKMDQHIRNDCHVEEEKKKLYRNSCSHKNCKKKELVQVNCTTCHRKFCLKHRFETDHDCDGPPGSKKDFKKTPKLTSHRNPASTTLTGIGADLNKERLARRKEQNQPQQKQHLSTDHALATALAASLHEPHPLPPHQPHPPHVEDEAQQIAQCEEDEALARAIAASLQQQKNTKPIEPVDSNSACDIS